MTEIEARPGRFAAAAPAQLEDDSAPALNDQDRDLHALCERWVFWCRTRRLYGPAPITGTILGKLSGSSTRPVNSDGPDAISSAELSAFHIAYTCQPREALDRQVFDLYYVYRVKPVKLATDALGISRAHYYRLLSEFRVRLYAAAQRIQSDSQEDLKRLNSRLLN